MGGDPVPELAAGMVWLDAERDATDDRVGLRSQCDRERDTRTRCPSSRVSGDPFRSGTLRIWMRNVERRIGNFPCTSQTLYVRSIGLSERPQNESFSS